MPHIAVAVAADLVALIAQELHALAQHRFHLPQIELPLLAVGFGPVLSRTNDGDVLVPGDAHARALVLERRPSARGLERIGLGQRDPIASGSPIGVLLNFLADAS